ncbi:MAG: aldo/keto reductase [Anaerolineae bacterium]
MRSARRTGAPLAVAIGWTLRHPAVTGAIVGARHPEQIDGIIGAIDFRLSEAEIQQIADFVARMPTT